jgi:hypothetical protein
MSFLSYGQLMYLAYAWGFIRRYGLPILFFGALAAGLVGIGYVWGHR